jgi:hypothetical protein
VGELQQRWKTSRDATPRLFDINTNRYGDDEVLCSGGEVPERCGGVVVGYIVLHTN